MSALAPAGTAAAGENVRYVRWVGERNAEGNIEVVSLKTIDAELTPRDWDVTDPAAQQLAAERELGDLAAYMPCGLQWWVHPESNSAVLAVYRGRE